MLKDFAKVLTFLTVVRERSFSKASAKMGISQPAVTQQIKFIEEYMQAKLLDRKKNGIILTKEGDELYRIAQRLEKCIQNTEKEIVKIINKELNFIISSSYTIGSYILPAYLNDIKESIANEVFINIKKSSEAIDDLVTEKADIALIESPNFRDGVIYREWMEDELVFFSNMPLPKYIKPSDLKKYAWVCREENSHTRKVMAEIFGELAVSCSEDFDMRSVLSDSTAVKQTILRYPTDAKKQVIAVMSRFVIADEVERGVLFESRLKTKKIKRKLYIAYLKQDKHNAYVDNVVKYLQGIKLANT
ncbi:MAG TPA: LysR family transcriptional regulator [Campylobacterales bacterium]|nr:LysR family transcriptional regulator [Campylobacterales bacterium]